VLTGAVFADLGQTAITSDNDIELRINNGTVSTWRFGANGNLTTPGSIIGPADSFFDIKVIDTGPGASLQLGDWDVAGFPKSLVQISDNVHIVTGVTTGGGDWTFDTNGTLTVPGDIVAQEGNDINVVVYNPTVEGTPGGVTFSVQNCDVESGHKTTQFDVGPSDIVLTTDFSGTKNDWTFGANGNLTLPGQGKIVPGSQTMLKATESAGIVSLMGYSGDTGINVNDTDGVDVLTNNGSDHNWNFGTDGTTAFPDNKIKQQANTNLRIETRLDYNVATLVDGNSGYNDWAPGTVIGAATTNFNGHGSGMTVDITTVNIGEFNGVVVSVVVNNPGTGYQNGDLIYILGGNNGATFTIGNYSSTLSDTTSTWIFGSDGNLTLPDASILPTACGQKSISLDGDNLTIDLSTQTTTYNVIVVQPAPGYFGSDTHTIVLGQAVVGQRLVVVNISTYCALQIGAYVVPNAGTLQGTAEFIYATLDGTSGWIPLYGVTI